MLQHLSIKHNVTLESSSSTQSTPNPITSLWQQRSNKEAMERFEYNLIRWIVADDMAFSSIESPFFQQMINDIPGISMPFTSRNTLTSRIAAQFELDRQQLVKELATSCQTIAVSLDGWTSNNDVSILGVIGHWLTEDFEYKEALLEYAEIEGPKSGENMGAIVLQLLDELDLERKLLSITADNASNNETLIDEVETGLREQFLHTESSNALRFRGQDSYIRCLAHVLNLIVKEILKTLKLGDRKLAEESVELILQHQYINTTDSALARLRVLAIWLLRTPERKSQWRNLCTHNNLEDNLIPYDVDNRWNSTYLMINAGIRARRQISRWISSHSEMPQFTDGDWEFLQQLSTILQRFYEHTEHVSRSAPQISYAVPIYYDLHNLINNAANREGEFQTLDKDIAAAVGSALGKYSKYYDLIDGLDIYYIALILNPRYKTRLLEQELGDEASNLIIQNIKEVLHQEYPPIISSSQIPSSSQFLRQSLEARLLSKIQPSTSLISDIDRYFNDPLAQIPEESAKDPNWLFNW